MRDYECETSEYLSRITKTAMGLAGTAFHVLDLLDIDVVWEARLPDYNRHPERYRGGQCRVVSNDACEERADCGDVREPRSPATVV